MSAALDCGLNAILCVGETKEEREQGKTLDVVKKQIEESLSLNASYNNIVLAYEPIWAIGTGLVPSLEEIQEVHLAIRSFLSSLKGKSFADNLRIV